MSMNWMAVIFHNIHSCEQVVRDFMEDGCVYLELRTTPKDRPEHGMSKASYVEAVLEGLKPYQSLQGLRYDNQEGDTSDENRSAADADEEKHLSILVKLILSIDRREGSEEAMNTVMLAAQYPGIVVGIDLSGNPTVGCWSQWRDALIKARQLGLKIAVHAAEVYAPEETAAILDFAPDRLGHMCKLNAELEAKLLDSKIPVELCLTSNLKTKTVDTYADHHFAQLYGAGCPVVLCTDDSGFFDTSLTREYAIAMQVFSLSSGNIFQLVEGSFEFLFCNEEEKMHVVHFARGKLHKMSADT
ncbi:hypothetical protein CEUSTIGMA_g10940.t1 [Chlamydomonas eustigma]|uniref:Adenosine deaminase domain-containing protein n=1 Tax=Chlamydomonas eustigma TaxID=1157962 RepID=A0A250XKA7_9CHLO|nr:hypothetical protein CEUSTIGMA_g10940.t1 [Chlamydomonas eustigma]|eukprot:GAX83515.1 hypothetical protein CEUSTIGMA_g10940.t1 [Chlamydomonas eustigma]